MYTKRQKGIYGDRKHETTCSHKVTRHKFNLLQINIECCKNVDTVFIFLYLANYKVDLFVGFEGVYFHLYMSRKGERDLILGSQFLEQDH